MTTNNSHDNPTGTTHFGFRTVAEGDKVALVRDVFDSVAGKYDLMNDLMSVGIHRLWKSTFLDMLRPRPDQVLLDVGGGTGDIAFGWKKRGGGKVTVCDINREMLSVGRDRAVDRNLSSGVTWVCGNAESLPIPDRSVDRYTIAFCLRNVTNWENAIAEAYRVLKPGGRFMCLEFSHVIVPGLKQAYDAYSFNVLPRVGELVTGNRDAYQYLVESIRKFPPQGELAAMIGDAGFERVTVRNLSAGIAAIHSGWRV
ncbi:bifunctional demethylmenaquinone methyltransferase/2-methoxy-6-polyprenyl-1,4-benzoquinol methylase UbiE [Magnetospirillum molischianum]|uniref:Ubiquinone/menaquinone biosynthesis C-methyltransferase UbiE n=1 Tax=Magnetospirillum molischianum DSM 120 TaxID=1150626 RepID=H8FXA4_MAGML|nr:bifunctional demethylmenaquinone methyltransferase/2-methoxy-6-polyprenyl-1,4-benzoquinol methylase UbiE [Magnetospirillum molischianum]CCG42992.1 Ubiquinone/menaquinone biosynthesis methyltransferase ubiE [Magnetospirillum molischianum DSM 120]